MSTPPTGRIVDSQYRGWRATGTTEYSTFDGHSSTTSTYEDLQTSAPLRPVVTPSPEDVEMIKAALREAGTQAVGTLIAAIAAANDHATMSPGTAQRALTAGRPGSWEAATLVAVVQSVGADLWATRVAVGPLSSLVAALTRWVNGPDAYVELAENLAGIVSTVADESGESGWGAVADDWFEPGEDAYRLFYSRSAYYS